MIAARPRARRVVVFMEGSYLLDLFLFGRDIGASENGRPCADCTKA
jgi:hypothetical protein